MLVAEDLLQLPTHDETGKLTLDRNHIDWTCASRSWSGWSDRGIPGGARQDASGN